MLITPARRVRRPFSELPALAYAVAATAFVGALYGLTRLYVASERLYLTLTISKTPPGIYTPDSLASIPRNRSLSKIFLFMPTSRIMPFHSTMGPRFCGVIQAAIVNGWSPILFNWHLSKEFNYNKPLEFAKLLDSPTHMAGIDPDDLILMADSLDVWLQLPPEYMVSRFLEKYDEDIVAGAEKNCWPPDSGCEKHAPSPLPEDLYVGDYPQRMLETPRHVNSGTVIGRLHKMQAFYRNVSEFMRSDEYKWKRYDDQGAFSVGLWQGKLKVDYEGRLVWNGHLDQEYMTFLNTPLPRPDDLVPWHLYPPLGHHRATGQVPVALHFNGAAKRSMEAWWGLSWWNSKRFRGVVKGRMEEGKVRFVADRGYNELSVRELCPGLDIWTE